VTSGSDRSRSLFLDWRALLSIALSVILLYFALRGIDVDRVVQEIQRADPLLFTLSIALATSSFALRAWRWEPLLHPIRPDVPFRPRFAAVCIGFMANNLLPARIGEVLRAYAISRIQPVPVAGAVGSIVIERLFDGFIIIAFVFVSLALPGFPQTRAGAQFESIVITLGVGFAAIALLLLAMVLWPRTVVRAVEAIAARLLPVRMRDSIIAALEALLSGLSAIRHPALLAKITAQSVILWLVSGCSYWAGLRAFDIQVPFQAAIFLQSLISLAVALPSGPGFFGPFEAGVRVGLVEVWGVGINKAMGFAIGYHLGGFIPVTLIGLYYVSRLGLSLKSAAMDTRVVKEELEHPHGESLRP
jgi:uncharacterized protein (TIRG00374 family)